MDKRNTERSSERIQHRADTGENGAEVEPQLTASEPLCELAQFLQSFRDPDQAKYQLTDQSRDLIRRHVDESLPKELEEFVISMKLQSDLWNLAVLEERQRRRSS